MLKVVIDATPLREKPSGVGLYVYNLVTSLYQLQEQEKFQLGIAYQPSIKQWITGQFIRPKVLKNYSNFYQLPIPVTITNLLAKYPNPIIPHFEKYLKYPDIVQGTDHFVYPCKHSLNIMTIHDLTFLKYPDYTTSIVRGYANRVKQCLTWTDLIITFSQNSKQDIVELLNVNPDQIYVTPQASRYSSEYLSAELTEKLQNSNQYNFSQPYLLFVSTLEPRKNVNNLILAFNYLKKKHKIEHHLVLIGQKGWRYKSIFEAIKRSTWQHQIHHLDYLSDELVALFYAKADVFIYPSYYEGFGLPILEAMTLGTPVVASNTSSLPEVAGNAALLVNPNNYIELAEAILNVISDQQIRQDLIQKGQARAKLFSWEKTALETLKVYRFLLEINS